MQISVLWMNSYKVSVLSFLIYQGMQLSHHNCLRLACSPEMNTNFKSQMMITAALRIYTGHRISITNRTSKHCMKAHLAAKRAFQNLQQNEIGQELLNSNTHITIKWTFDNIRESMEHPMHCKQLQVFNIKSHPHWNSLLLGRHFPGSGWCRFLTRLLKAKKQKLEYKNNYQEHVLFIGRGNSRII